MARNERVTCPVGTWTQLTNADCTGNLSVELLSDTPVSLMATATATAPTVADGPLTLESKGDGWSKATIAEMFPGVTSPVRLFAKPLGAAPVALGVSHGA